MNKKNKWLSKLYRRIPSELKYIAGLFLVTRVALTIIGFTSVKVLSQFMPHNNMCMGPKLAASHHTLFNIWFNWDSGHYFNIATHGYSASAANYGFFPLYPLTIKLTSMILPVNNFWIGLILSNIYLFIACYFLYKLVRLNHDDKFAKLSVKYLLLLPVGFVLSAYLSESLFIMLVIITFYYAKKSNWWLAGLFGGLLSLSRSIGVLVVVPLVVEYFSQRQFNIKKIKTDILALGLIPIGLVPFMIYTHILVNDYFGFATIQKTTWHNPVSTLLQGLKPDNLYALAVIFTIISLVLVLSYCKKISASLMTYSLIAIIVPVMSGPRFLQSLPRYLMVVFPLAIILAAIAKTRNRDEVLTISLAILQGGLMILWVNCWLVYIV